MHRALIIRIILVFNIYGTYRNHVWLNLNVRSIAQQLAFEGVKFCKLVSYCFYLMRSAFHQVIGFSSKSAKSIEFVYPTNNKLYMRLHSCCLWMICRILRIHILRTNLLLRQAFEIIMLMLKEWKRDWTVCVFHIL